MRHLSLFLIAVLILSAGCSRAPKSNDILAKVNNCTITRAEFEEEFKGSPFSAIDTPESRIEFMNSLIDRKLILQDAERKGLDKDKAFLRMVERFWEQSLLKLALDRKSREIAGSGIVSDKEIRDLYEKMVREGKTQKAYAEMYGQLNWELTKFKEAQLMNDWLSDLHKKARIKISKDMLNK